MMEEEKKAESSLDNQDEEDKNSVTAATAAAASTPCANDDDEDYRLDHQLAPGDHVIRWEFLPIAWPIQVHGIVLETGKGYVSICDFGLTAEPRHDLKDEAAAATTTMEQGGTTSNKAFQAAWDKVKPADNTKKQRITVHIITEKEDLKAWKKVNYGQGLFGGNVTATDATDHDKDKQDDDSVDQASQHSKGSNFGTTAAEDNQQHDNKNIHHRVGKWWHHVTQRSPGKKTAQTADNHDAPGEQESEQQLHATSMAATSTTILGTNGTVMSTPGKKVAGKGTDPTEPTSTSIETQTTTPRRRIFQMIHRSKSRSHSPIKEKNKNNKNNNKLPKSDPPKLVLARTVFLLAQGDSVLPPYHPFKANSECIAVFCKTGRWSTLQASVFLHSTAIGNAKSSMAVTLGVAASAPFLAPAIAGIGIVAVGAPYVILNQSREFWQQQTIRLNDLFWSQAEPEVFVECIEHWSKLGDKPKQQQQKKQHPSVVKLDSGKANRNAKAEVAVGNKIKKDQVAPTNCAANDESKETNIPNGGTSDGEERDKPKERFVSV